MAGQLKASPLCQRAFPAAPEALIAGGDSNTGRGEGTATPEGTKRRHQRPPGVAVPFPREGDPSGHCQGRDWEWGWIPIVPFWD